MASIEKPPRLLLIPLSQEGHWKLFLHLLWQFVAHGINFTVLTTKKRADELMGLKAGGKFENVEVEIAEVFRETMHVQKTSIHVEVMMADLEAYRNKLTPSMPSFSCIIADMFLGSVCQGLADEWGIPRYSLTTTASYFAFIMLHAPILVDEGWVSNNPAKANVFCHLPGLELFTGADMPEALVKIPETYKTHSVYIRRAAGLIINAFEEFEGRLINVLKQQLELHADPGRAKPKVFPIGPVQFLPSFSTSEDDNAPREKSESIKWLDTRKKSSVLFICFGSVLPLTAELSSAFMEALESTGVSFLWALRISKEESPEKTAVRAEFEARTQDRGLVVTSWVSQEEVLMHPSVSGFLSHCGWNSILESLRAGVPIVACPVYAEQGLNARYIVDEAKIGVAIKHKGRVGEVDGEEVAKSINFLMKEETREILTQNILKLKEAAFATVSEGGSSHQNLKNLIAELSKAK